MWPFKKKVGSEIQKTPEQWEEEYYTELMEYAVTSTCGNMLIIQDNEWEGFVNNVDTIMRIEKEGWVYVDTILYEQAEHIEIIFRRHKNGKEIIQ